MKYRSFAILFAVLLLFSGCKKQNEGPVSELSGAGYQSLYQVGETCYLTDRSGVIYTLDLVTGEKELYGKPPVSYRWVASPDLSCIYYMKNADLCRYSFSSETEAVICSLSECDEIYAVTENYLLFIEGIFPDGEGVKEAYICSLNLSTLEIRRETDVWGNLIGTATGNLIFTADMVEEPSGDRSKPNGLWAFGVKDLENGTQTMFLENETNFPFEHAITVIDDTVYFIMNATVYSVPVTGGEMVPVSFYPNNLKISPCGDKGILGASFVPDETVVWYYDHFTGDKIKLLSTVGVMSMASDGSRYAVLTSDSMGNGKIIFGDIAAS